MEQGAEFTMKCPFCGHQEDKVLDTRVQKNDGGIRRRRECLSCKSRFTTLETLLLQYPVIVKKDGRREAFSKDKILRGLQAATQKRPVSQSQLENLVDQISSWAIQKGESEIPSSLIGKKVIAELRLLDDVAYVRFASVYRQFHHVREFVETLEDEDLVGGGLPSPDQLPLQKVEPSPMPTKEADLT